jgi:hypothetical protein
MRRIFSVRTLLFAAVCGLAGLIPSASALGDTETAFFDSYPNGTKVVQFGNVTFTVGSSH